MIIDFSFLSLPRDRDQEARMVEDVFWDPHLVLTSDDGEEDIQDESAISLQHQVEILGPEDPVRLLRLEALGRSQEVGVHSLRNQEAGVLGEGSQKAAAGSRGRGSPEVAGCNGRSQNAAAKKATGAAWDGDTSEAAVLRPHRGFTPYPPEIKVYNLNIFPIFY